mgnify:CR=1 FL=1
MTTIEKDIKAIIEEVTCSKYVGKLKVVQDIVDDSIIWMLLLYLDMEMTPMVLAYEGTEEKFKDFIRDEMKSRKLQGVHFWKGVQEYPTYDDYE